MMRGAARTSSLPALRRGRSGRRLSRRGAASRSVLQAWPSGSICSRSTSSATVDHFSGGNQQKVLLAKSLSRAVQLFVFDEPTVGVDVGTRVAIYRFIAELCEAGAAMLLISSDLPGDAASEPSRVRHVPWRAAGRVLGSDITEQNVLSHFFEREAA